MANESIPVYRPGADLTVKAGATITGKTFVKVSAAINPTTGVLATVVVGTAGAAALGVATADAANGSNLAVISGPGTVTPVTAGGTFSAGAEVEVGSGGKVVAFSTGIKVGYALSAGAADADAIIKLY